MTQRMGTSGRDVPLETQFLLVEGKDEKASTVYTVFLPLLDGPFRAVLQGNDKDEIEMCLESGDEAVETKQGVHMVYMHAGANPFEVINQAVKYVAPVNFIGSEVRDQTAAVVQEGAQYASRPSVLVRDDPREWLTGIKENAKFQRKQGEGERRTGLKLLVEEVKKRRNVK
ncbi:hypothetical protein BHM03_00037218 [Ensete ventricosum]|uniref:Uncharacterized protein n=1 Tax=Ensete ventricosum TaxID=4639 RepID=A0A445MJM2_ENSVE|nr:hypothetical protein BHM03_00037218 [Ensete ventricosum]